MYLYVLFRCFPRAAPHLANRTAVNCWVGSDAGESSRRNAAIGSTRPCRSWNGWSRARTRSRAPPSWRKPKSSNWPWITWSNCTHEVGFLPFSFFLIHLTISKIIKNGVSISLLVRWKISDEDVDHLLLSLDRKTSSSQNSLNDVSCSYKSRTSRVAFFLPHFPLLQLEKPN